MRAMNLFMADARRIKKSKALLIILCVALGYSLLYISLMKLADYLTSLIEFAVPQMDFGKMALGVVLGANTFVFIAAIGIGIFSGSEFAYNTVRNRIISGNSRTKIWFSQFLMNLAIFFAMYFAVAVFSTALCALMFGGFADFGGTMARLALSLPLYVCMVAIITLVITGTKSLTLGLVINLLVLMLVPQILGMILMFIPNQTWVAVLETNPYIMLPKVLGADMTSLIGGGVLAFNRTDIK